MGLLEKYKMWNVVIKDRHGQEHRLKQPEDDSEVKLEEAEKDASRIMATELQTLGWADSSDRISLCLKTYEIFRQES